MMELAEPEVGKTLNEIHSYHFPNTFENLQWLQQTWVRHSLWLGLVTQQASLYLSTNKRTHVSPSEQGTNLVASDRETRVPTNWTCMKSQENSLV